MARPRKNIKVEDILGKVETVDVKVILQDDTPQEEVKEVIENMPDVKIKAIRNIDFGILKLEKNKIEIFEHSKFVELANQLPNLRDYMNCGIIEVIA